MTNTFWVILAVVLLASGFAYANSKVEKTADGFIFKESTSHTYYINKVAWGEGYTDHASGSGVYGTKVVAYGTDWEYETTTDALGVFKVEVAPASPFKLKIADGNDWVQYPTTLPAITEGTTFSELK